MLFGILPYLALSVSFPQKMSGPWYYISDGKTNSHPFANTPSWMFNAGNTISLSFLNPSDLVDVNSSPVPQVYNSTASLFKSRGKTVFFSIGGEAYGQNWGWLSNPTQTNLAATRCARIAQSLGVGIEIDYEGGANPVTGLTNFVKAFRAVCPVGECMLSMDLYGSPGGQWWQTDVIKAILPPNGKPGQKHSDGNHLDFVNVMVIDGQPVSSAMTYWKQWVNAGLTMTRSTFGLIAGWPGLGICFGDSRSVADIHTAWNFLSAYDTYGIMSWAVCPPASGTQQSCSDWSASCNSAAPGFATLCSTVGAC